MGTTPTKETRRRTPAVRPKSSQHTTAQAAAAGSPQVQALANLQRMADSSPQVQALASLQRMADARATVQRRPDPAPVQRLEEDELQGKFIQRVEEDELQMKPVQRMEEDELQGKFIQRVEEEELQMKPIQRMEEDELQGKFIQRVEDEELLQGKALQRAEAPKANNTGLPDTLKSGIESLSGLSMDHVQVHRNSDKPAAVQAHAYAQGSDIHLGPGQEQHLPHEAWHVVQQAQGRVKPTMQMKGVAVNDDAGLEAEADVMGAKAASLTTSSPQNLHKKKGTGRVTQTKNLEQTRWLTDLVPDAGGKRSVVGDGRDVNVYHDPKSIVVTDRNAGLAKASELNAKVGKKVDQEGSNWAFKWDSKKRENVKNTNAKWTPKNWLLDNERTSKIDPFFYEAIVSFPSAPSAKTLGHTDYMGFLFQHASSFTGYVEAVMDTTNDHAAGVPTMYRGERPARGRNPGDPGDKAEAEGDDRRNPKFTNVHDQADKADLLDMTSSGGGEKNYDAYTKIVGEGARWKCVRNHASNLKNDSKFFTTHHQNKRKVWAITFVDLWLSWKSDFDKTYDIEDSAVAEAIFKKPLSKKRRPHWRSEMTSSDYNLEQ